MQQCRNVREKKDRELRVMSRHSVTLYYKMLVTLYHIHRHLFLTELYTRPRIISHFYYSRTISLSFPFFFLSLSS